MCLMVPMALPEGVKLVMQRRNDDYVIFYNPEEACEPEALDLYDETKKIDSIAKA